jgi:hypothetical protein
MRLCHLLYRAASYQFAASSDCWMQSEVTDLFVGVMLMMLMMLMMPMIMRGLIPIPMIFFHVRLF